MSFAPLDPASIKGLNDTLTASGVATATKVTKAVDLPSIATTVTNVSTVTITGVVVGQAVLAAPPAALATGGLTLLSAYVSAADTVTLVVQNPTGGSVDAASANWVFTVFA